MRRLVLVLMLALLAPVVHAQPRQPPPPPAVNQRQAVKTKIREIRRGVLTDKLLLDEETAKKLFPLLAHYDDETDKLVQQRVEITKRLNTSGGKPAKDVERAIDDAVANQKAFWDLEDKRLGEIRRILTPNQVAKLLIVLPALERKIQNQLRKAIQNGIRQRDDDDDDIEPDEVAPTQHPGRRPPGRP